MLYLLLIVVITRTVSFTLVAAHLTRLCFVFVFILCRMVMLFVHLAWARTHHAAYFIVFLVHGCNTLMNDVLRLFYPHAREVLGFWVFGMRMKGHIK